jgi:hypothetical protein
MMTLDYSIDFGHAEATTPEFGCKKRVKEPALCLGVHAATGVCNFQKNEKTRRRLFLQAALTQIGLIAIHLAGFYGYMPTIVAKGLSAVYDQIRDNSLYLVFISSNQRDIFIDL